MEGLGEKAEGVVEVVVLCVAWPMRRPKNSSVKKKLAGGVFFLFFINAAQLFSDTFFTSELINPLIDTHNLI